MINISLKLCISILFISFLVGFSPNNLEARMVNEILDNQEEIQLEEENQVDESEGVTETDDQLAVESPSFIGSFFKLILALAVVIGLIVLISKFLRKKNGFLKKHQVIENYGGITVGSNKSIQTIKIGDRFYVIGVADNIELLMEITDPNTIEQLMKKEETSDSLDKLKAKLTKQPVESTKSSNQNFTSLFNKELNTMKEGRKKVYQKLKESSRKNDDSSH
ncbi:flagellar biosynthetic protein FliO [Gracilibacillus saliphilus]|uniref:flagellar biosynthetic protein FliO n=1 Tax=Gracilibacillus saliphilus TaxID=543890 RepID=UPI0013D5A536|nr:flagellar biosynthetic protein FliO [Gracilibacillus saliphilus]